ncbi:hypothetical protein DUNSADRAFT_5933 [Dunaliella salina]|uniref:Encoded protein n=1 Tax=Dunaliella salina TaxID=3046 RepID=A0ABQ7GP98_DUNSA|nr:hypothetical protein DUNSADRAFT_5933 [Dunaliella salina]|eukprot:KAF5836427.1 hypothetical protein DUNSADRAFT_5933 [Dunaliella salina]
MRGRAKEGYGQGSLLCGAFMQSTSVPFCSQGHSSVTTTVTGWLLAQSLRRSRSCSNKGCKQRLLSHCPGAGFRQRLHCSIVFRFRASMDSCATCMH